MLKTLISTTAVVFLVGSLATVAGATANPLSDSNFYFWNTCSPAGYDYSGGLIVPEGTGSCVPDYVAAQETHAQTASGFSFYGTMTGGSGAGSSSDQEAVFLADNTSSFTGHEMGFIKTLNNNELQAYLQAPGGVFIYHDISSNDNGWHTFAAKDAASYGGNPDQVDFYIDGNYVCSLNDGQSYENLNYTYVATTHRMDGGSWNSGGGEEIQLYSMTYY